MEITGYMEDRALMGWFVQLHVRKGGFNLFLGEGMIRRWRMSDERGVQTAKGASENEITVMMRIDFKLD
jgi:hypothetical protein